MKTLYFLTCFTVVSLMLQSCKKKDETGNHSSYIPSASIKVFLRNTNQTDTSFTLNWTKLNSNCFQKYFVLRETGNDSNDISLYSNYIIAEINQQDVCTYTDQSPLFAPSVKYQVVAYTCNGMINSNIIMLKKNVTIFNLNNISNVLIDKDSNKLIILESYNGTKITSFDYENQKIAKTLQLSFSTYASCLGDYNNTKELYLSSGSYPYKIYIYNSHTLTAIDNFSITNYSNCIEACNNKIFIDAYYSSYNNSVSCYNRANKTLISSEGPGYSSLKFKAIPNTNTSLIGMSSYYGVFKINFNSNGQAASYTQSNNISSYSNDFQISPSGNYFVVNYDGSIYKTSDFSQVTSLSGYYSNYGLAINNDDTKIYICQSYNKMIDEFSLLSGVKIRSYNTSGNPNKIFIDDGKIIALSKIEYTNTSYVVEKITIK